MRQEFAGIVRLPDTERIYDAPRYVSALTRLFMDLSLALDLRNAGSVP